MHYFEIIGTPGAGKSAVLANLQKSHIATLNSLRSRSMIGKGRAAIGLLPRRVRNRITNSFGPDLGHAAGFAAERLDLVHSVLDLVEGIADFRHRQKVLKFALRDWANYHYMRHMARTDEAVVADEGMSQHLASILIRQQSLPEDAMTFYCDSLPTFSGIIWLQTPLELALSRISGRARGLHTPENVSVDEWVSEFADQIGRVVALLEERGIHISRVSGSSPLQDVTDAVVEIIDGVASRQSLLNG